MLMNRIETLVVNSLPRRWLQHYEARVLARLGGRTPGARVAEIGCGSGYGTRLILDHFGAASVDAVDLDPAMIAHAQRRLVRHAGGVRLAQGSATDLRTAFDAFGGGLDGGYDAVFDFVTIHHIPNWRDALAEVARVLAPGGRFFFEEVTATALARPSYRVLFAHPTEDRFTAGEFLAELPHHGLRVDDRWHTRIGSDYLLGVATRQ
jgi:ubiquinone/menaquinone biosynthesis C-methylase UbiE